MKIVIIGLGTIGKTILKSLSQEEDHTITIIDQNKALVEGLMEKYDVLGVSGNGACLSVQEEANVKEADLVIALTPGDELNILICLAANKEGAGKTIARVRNPEYRRFITKMKDDLGIAMIVNPEMETANEIFSLISLPAVSGIEQFAKGRVSLVEIVADEGCSLIGESLFSLKKKFNVKVLICAVERRDEIIIPSGDFVPEKGDIIHFTADAKDLGEFLSVVKSAEAPLKNIMIVGGDRIGFYLADALSEKGYSVKIIEKNTAVADRLSDTLSDVIIVQGDGTQHDLLIEEGIDNTDAFVALTDVDEENMIVSMFANKRKVKKVIAKIKNDDLFGMFDEFNINNTVSPKLIVASRVIGYIRALENSKGSNVLNLYKLLNDRVEALEFYARKQEDIYNRPLKELSIKENCLIGCIIRNNEIIIPNGETEIQLGDNVVVVTTHKNFDDLTDVFK